VKGSAPAPATSGRWLVLTEEGSVHLPVTTARLIELLKQENPELHVAPSSQVSEMRPSFLNQFSAVVDLSGSAPESFVRHLVVRNLPVVAVGREPRGYSVHSVLVDEELGLSRVARDLLLAGHRRLGAVEPIGQTTVARVLYQAAQRIAPDATIEGCTIDDVVTLLQDGTTAFVCHSPSAARYVSSALADAAADVPGRASVAAVGNICGSDSGNDAPCTGYFVDCSRLAEAVVQLLKDAPMSARPATLWLAGELIDCGTTAVGSAAPGADAAVDTTGRYDRLLA